jgi:hypothetical protein
MSVNPSLWMPPVTPDREKLKDSRQERRSNAEPALYCQRSAAFHASHRPETRFCREHSVPLFTAFHGTVTFLKGRPIGAYLLEAH